MHRIPLTRPETDEEELDEVAAVLRSGHLTQGPKVAELEQGVAELVGSRHAIATSSATTALHLSLAALGIARGDDVLVADFTFPATANVVVQQGARPILVDIDLDTFAINADDLKRRITSRSRAIIPVHPFGLPADMQSILEVAQAHGLAIVEDAACALGATYAGRHAGTFAKAGCFSFHPRKSITTGEGGMVVTDDDSLADTLRLLRSHGGHRRGGRFTFEAAGYNYRLSDILAAVGVAQLRKRSRLLEIRRAIAQRYSTLLAEVPRLQPPGEPAGSLHTYQSYVVLLEADVPRDEVITALDSKGIETTLGTYSLHREPFFMREYGYAPGDLPMSDAAFRRTLSLPLYPSMTTDEQDYVVAELAAALA